MKCPECGASRTGVTSVSKARSANQVEGHVLHRILDQFQDGIARRRKCAACKHTWYTIEVMVEAPPRVPKVPCSAGCTRQGVYIATSACRHPGIRCKRHSCKSCIKLAGTTVHGTVPATLVDKELITLG